MKIEKLLIKKNLSLSLSKSEIFHTLDVSMLCASLYVCMEARMYGLLLLSWEDIDVYIDV